MERISAGDRIFFDEITTVDGKNCTVVIGDPIRPSYTLKTEICEVLKEHKNKNLLIPMSGGIDSECVAEAALDAKVPFTAATMRYIVDGQYMNDYDTKYAFDFCRKHNIAHEVLDLNLNDFLDNGHYIKYAIDYQCRSPQLACHLWLMDQFPNHFPVIAGNLMHVGFSLDGTILSLVPMGYMYYCYWRYLHKTGRSGIGNIMQYNPEIIFATLDIARVLFKEHGRFPNDSYNEKCAALLHGGFDAKPRVKATGFEAIRFYYSDKYNENGTVREFNNRYRKPIESMVTEPNRMELICHETIQNSLRYLKKLVGDTNEGISSNQ
jgi:hypothetical protein